MSSIGSIGGPAALLAAPPAQPAQSQAPTTTQSGTKMDRDGDFDNSTALTDAAEGRGGNVNLVA
ncbi:MAG: hypothetical protein ACYDAG_11550 [Chloroflexota bacterium]